MILSMIHIKELNGMQLAFKDAKKVFLTINCEKAS